MKTLPSREEVKSVLSDKLHYEASSSLLSVTKCRRLSDKAIEFSWIGLGLILKEGEFTTNVASYDNEMKYLN